MSINLSYSGDNNKKQIKYSFMIHDSFKREMRKISFLSRAENKDFSRTIRRLRSFKMTSVKKEKKMRGKK